MTTTVQWTFIITHVLHFVRVIFCSCSGWVVFDFISSFDSFYPLHVTTTPVL